MLSRTLIRTWRTWQRTTPCSRTLPLFGDGFTKKAKERDDKLKRLSQASKRSNSKQYSFFSRRPLPQHKRLSLTVGRLELPRESRERDHLQQVQFLQQAPLQHSWMEGQPAQKNREHVKDYTCIPHSLPPTFMKRD